MLEIEVNILTFKEKVSIASPKIMKVTLYHRCNKFFNQLICLDNGKLNFLQKPPY